MQARNELCRTPGVRLVGEAVKTEKEYRLLQQLGVRLMQGHLFARAAFEALPEVGWPKDKARQVQSLIAGRRLSARWANLPASVGRSDTISV